ncbi:uncharacterized protein YjeT (DUF2065 family) [Spinactinospora alkalitolerans]|uniref:Uncharacterized protein YjeT (DUF2065 family) n=1 Tax=Spinactinospora alkalitolerans TaxID=687207 RepID=A0A852TVZ5_9ACTN|nr:PQQ-binding-like beta-propeller repeat protein [Spinactinospora alkalitolerans]NYE47565.1 uncharacterized protein YjeT (DUF2065 family) [Spinactinospora alkalitolerans]
MAERLKGVLGWTGIAVLVGAVVLMVPRLFGLDEDVAAGQDLSPLIVAALVLGLAAGGFVTLRFPDGHGDRGTGRPDLVGAIVRVAAVLAGFALVWATYPTRHLAPAVRNGDYRMFPGMVTELWIGVCLVALGLVLLCSGSSLLLPQSWKRALTGLTAGILAVILLWGMTPPLTRFLMVEHAVAKTVGDPAPVPADISRVGWSWQPEHRVMGVERGPRGPIVRYADGFVALDGADGEELWTYRLPYARQVETGVFAGDERYAYLLYVAEPELETRTMVVLDTATGEVVRNAPMPELGEDAPSKGPHLTPDLRVFLVQEDGGAVVVAHATDSAERIWEFPLEDSTPERLCRWDGNDGIREHGDRVLVARLCLDEEHLPDHDRSAALANMDVPDDAVESVVALDTATGQQVWRREWTPDDLSTGDLPYVGGTREGRGAEPVAVTEGGTFTLATGEPVRVRPEKPGDPRRHRDHTLAIDTAGAVVLREAVLRLEEAEKPALVLRTDAAGEVVQRTELAPDIVGRYLESVHVLDEVLVAPHVERDDSTENPIRALAAVPLGAEVGEDDLVWIDFGGERLPETPDSRQTQALHRTLAVPGAVVSYVIDPNESGSDLSPLHGLVP